PRGAQPANIEIRVMSKLPKPRGSGSRSHAQDFLPSPSLGVARLSGQMFRLGVIVTLIFFTVTADAANWYVRPNASGANSGTDWNNAWSLSSINWANVNGGDTIWLAGGTYAAQL